MVKIHLSVSYHSDETAVSLLSRLAAANRVQSVPEFSRLVHLNWRKIEHGDQNELRSLFDLAGFDPDLARVSQPRRLDNLHRKFQFDVVTSKRLAMTAVRFCPACLKADMDLSADHPLLAPYGRLSWLLSSFRTCPEHSLPLSQIPQSEIRNVNYLGSVRPYLTEPIKISADQATRASDFEAYLDLRLRTGKGGATLPDGLGMQGLMTACEAIGQVAEFGPGVRHKTLTEHSQALAANSGFNLLKRGEDALSEFLASLEPSKAGPRKASIHRTWGRFYEVVNLYRGDDLGPVKTVLRDAILRRYPKKAGTVVLDERVKSQTVHTLESAATAADISPKTLRRLFQHEPSLLTLDADVNLAGSINDEALDALREVVFRFMTIETVSRFLGVSRVQLGRLVKHGFVTKIPGTDRYYDKASADKLMASLEGSSVSTISAPPGTWSLPEAISAGLSTEKAINFVIRRRLDQVWCVKSRVGLNRIWLDKIESKRKLHSAASF
jgi:hypothetical protein